MERAALASQADQNSQFVVWDVVETTKEVFQAMLQLHEGRFLQVLLRHR